MIDEPISKVIEKYTDEEWEVIAWEAYTKFKNEVGTITDKSKVFRDLSAKEKNAWKNICVEVLYAADKFKVSLTGDYKKAYEIYEKGDDLDSFCNFCKDKKISEEDMDRIMNIFDFKYGISVKPF